MIPEIGGDFVQWLRGFYFVAKTHGVASASPEMGRNPPAITHQIKCLENELGATLFDRSGGKMELTPEGEKVLDITISLFELIQKMKNEVCQKNSQLEGKVRIASTHGLILYYLPRYIVNFQERNAHTKFQIEGGGLDMIIDRVESSQADFGIACFESVPTRFNYDELFETKLKLIVSKGRAYWPEGKLTLERISKAPFIAFPCTSTITPFIERKFSEHGLKLNVTQEFNNFEIVKKYVECGMGISILDEYTLTKEDEDKFDIYSLDLFFEKRIYFIFARKRKYLSPPVISFLLSFKPDLNLHREEK